MKKKIIYVSDIIEQFLKDNGYYGLCCPQEGCGCFIGDLVPCQYDCSKCIPGWKRYDSEEGWIISSEKPKKVEEND